MQSYMLFYWPSLHIKLYDRFSHLAQRSQDITRQAVEKKCKCHTTVHMSEKRVSLFIYCFLLVRVHHMKNYCFFSFRVVYSDLFTFVSFSRTPTYTSGAGLPVPGSDQRCLKVKVCGKLAFPICNKPEWPHSLLGQMPDKPRS